MTKFFYHNFVGSRFSVGSRISKLGSLIARANGKYDDRGNEEEDDDPRRWLFLAADKKWWVSDTADKDGRRAAGYSNSVDKVGLAGDACG